MSPSYDRSPATAVAGPSSPAVQPRFDEQDTIGNSAVLEGMAQPALAPSDPDAGADAPTCSAGRDDDVIALRVAIDLAQGGRWWSSQAVSGCHRDAIDDLRRVVLPLAVPPAESLQGAPALKAFDAAHARLEGAAASVDPVWVDQWYRPAMARLRRRILVETAMDAVDAHAEAASDPGAARAAIEQLEAELSTFRERLGLREAKLGRKGASEYVKVSEDFIRSNPIRVWNPSSHEWQVLATFEQITAWLALAKVVLMAADASPRAADAVTQPADTGTATEAVAEFTGRASAIIEGMAGIVGTTSLAMAKVLRLAALDSTLDAGPLVAAADRLEKGAVAIGRSKALSGVLAGLSLFRNGAILLDADSTTEQRADALVGIAAAGAEIAGVVTWRALLLRATLDEVWMLHERALRKPDPESIHAFATDLAERVSALLEDLPHLVGVESGILPDRAPSVTSAQAGSFYEQHPTE